MFKVGDKVEFVKYPNLKGTVREIMLAVDDLPEEISVDVFIPAGEPGFNFTGVTENFWCGSESLRALDGATGAATLSGLYNCEVCGKEKCRQPGICEECLTPPTEDEVKSWGVA